MLVAPYGIGQAACEDSCRVKPYSCSASNIQDLLIPGTLELSDLPQC
jgi:hypothetical protein